ncbi:hypothetical protein [Stenotrophomonas sp. PSU_St142]
MTTFKAGEEVYTTDGRLVEYVAQSYDGHIVRQLPERENEDYGPAPMGYPEVVHQVLKAPPSFKVDQDYAAKRDELAAVRAKLHTASQELAAVEKKRDAQLKQFASHPDLSIVVDWMEGRVTHVATFDLYGPTPIKIMPLADGLAPKGSESRKGKVRLLGLYGGYHGADGPGRYAHADDLRWQLSEYSEGSGSKTSCVLGTSEEDVRRRVQLWLDREFKRSDNQHALWNWAESAVALGFSVPPAWVAKVEERAANRRKQAQEQALKELESARARLAAAEAAAKAITP